MICVRISVSGFSEVVKFVLKLSKTSLVIRKFVHLIRNYPNSTTYLPNALPNGHKNVNTLNYKRKREYININTDAIKKKLMLMNYILNEPRNFDKAQKLTNHGKHRIYKRRNEMRVYVW